MEDKKGSRLAGLVVVEKGGGADAFGVVLAEGKEAWPWEKYWLVGLRKK
jgi:hypothetical protein